MLASVRLDDGGVLTDVKVVSRGTHYVVYYARQEGVWYVLCRNVDAGYLSTATAGEMCIRDSLYSFNNTPYASLGGVMSGDIKERTSITSIRFVAATIAQCVVQGLTLPLVSKFSDGGDKAHGWLCTISLFARCV